LLRRDYQQLFLPFLRENSIYDGFREGLRTEQCPTTRFNSNSEFKKLKLKMIILGSSRLLASPVRSLNPRIGMAFDSDCKVYTIMKKSTISRLSDCATLFWTISVGKTRLWAIEGQIKLTPTLLND
jgi:hypothetical protein